MTLKAIPTEPDLLGINVLKKPRKPKTTRKPRTTTPFDRWYSDPNLTPEERLRQYNQVLQEWYAKHPHQNWTKASITEHIFDFEPQERQAFFALFQIDEEDVTTEASTTTVASQQSNDLQNAESQACLLYTSPSPRDQRGSRMPSSA